MNKASKFTLLLVLLLFTSVSVSVAQEEILPYPEDGALSQNQGFNTPAVKTETIVNKNDEVKKLSLMNQVFYRIQLRTPSVMSSEIRSVFFTPEEIKFLRQAREGLVTSLPGYRGDDGGGADEELSLETIERVQGPRNIRLGGILYLSKSDWAIWLNEEEIRPNAIPQAVLDLRVHKEYIELEWYDTTTNQIYPIRLRPNQTFNLDARLFLPG